MLLVKTYLDKSPIHGIGLFAGELIPKGTMIWRLRPGFDLILSDKEFKKLPEATQEFIMHYSHFDENVKAHVLCSDHARFFNKPIAEPNCIGKDGATIAGVDIQKGEEMTEIYFNYNELYKK